jgi:hypothetical protein
MPPTPPPFMPPVPPTMQSEMVRLVVEKVNQKTGMFSKQTYRMLVTDSRLIFALQVNNGVDYMRQDPNLTLAENPANFAIPLDQLQVIEVYHSTFEDNTPDSMTVKTLSAKMTFNIYDALRIGQNLKKVLGNKVK